MAQQQVSLRPIKRKLQRYFELIECQNRYPSLQEIDMKIEALDEILSSEREEKGFASQYKMTYLKLRGKQNN